MTDQFSILTLVTGHLDAIGIAYMLTGAIAAGYYAQPRMTRDIDLVVEVEPADADRLAAAFAPEFTSDAAVIRGAIARQSVFNLIHVEAVAKVDFIARTDDRYRREEFRRRRAVELGGHRLWVVSGRSHPLKTGVGEAESIRAPAARRAAAPHRRAVA
jgi:hypothetical protein